MEEVLAAKQIVQRLIPASVKYRMKPRRKGKTEEICHEETHTNYINAPTNHMALEIINTFSFQLLDQQETSNSCHLSFR